jgi:hypothetical protein
MRQPSEAAMSTGMKMQTSRSIAIAFAVLFLSALCAAAQSDTNPPPPGPHVGDMTRHGLAGVVTSVSGSAIVIEIPENVTFTVHIGPSTRVAGAGQQAAPADIHPGDAIMASGDIDEQARTIQAIALTIQPPFAAQMLENLRASFGKTWTAGVVTAVQGNSITLTRKDGQFQTFSVDQDTVWRLGDQVAVSSLLRAGESIRVQLRPAGPAAKVTIQGMARENRSVP